MSSTKSSPKPRSRKRKEEPVAAVHKPLKNEADLEPTTPDQQQQQQQQQITNANNVTISRDMSIESELQINTKIENGIIGLIETEMKKEKSKYNHFSDSRPQSLSFYEEEKAPEELSGQLEQLSPEEKRVLKRRKDERKIDIELDASTYKEIQNVLNREKEDVLAGIMKSQKSKSRKKKQFDSEESLAGIGDSREQMIPTTKRKTKKTKSSKSKESSPSSGHKRKSRKRDEYETRNDITVALDELQDDVFDKDVADNVYQYETTQELKLPIPKSNTVYVQRRHGFEATPRDRLFTHFDVNREENSDKLFSDWIPIELALKIQKHWLPFTVLCHGLLAGLALSHTIVTHGSAMSQEFVKQYQTYSEPYTTAFYFLSIICLVSVFDRYDVKQMNSAHICDLLRNRKSALVVFVYMAALIVHLINAKFDEKITLSNYLKNDTNYTTEMITIDELSEWNALSMWRSLSAISGWIIVALTPNEDMLYGHLSSMDNNYAQNNPA